LFVIGLQECPPACPRCCPDEPADCSIKRRDKPCKCSCHQCRTAKPCGGAPSCGVCDSKDEDEPPVQYGQCCAPPQLCCPVCSGIDPSMDEGWFARMGLSMFSRPVNCGAHPGVGNCCERTPSSRYQRGDCKGCPITKSKPCEQARSTCCSERVTTLEAPKCRPRLGSKLDPCCGQERVTRLDCDEGSCQVVGCPRACRVGNVAMCGQCGATCGTRQEKKASCCPAVCARDGCPKDCCGRHLNNSCNKKSYCGLAIASTVVAVVAVAAFQRGRMTSG